MENIVKTTVGSVIPKLEKPISKAKKSINQLKEDVYEISDVEQVVECFRQSYSLKLKSHMSMFTTLSLVEKKQLNKKLSELKFAAKEVAMKQMINSNLEGLSCYLARLKVTMLTKDVKLTKQILEKFFKQDGMNLRYVEEDIKDFSVKIDLLEKAYFEFIDFINNISHSLEHRILLSADAIPYLESLRNVVLKQKELLYHINSNFTVVCEELKKDKVCKNVLKQFD